MTLLIDIGNSAVKWGWLDEQGALNDLGWAVHRDVADLASLLAQRWRAGTSAGTPAIGCNVAGARVGGAAEQAARNSGLGDVRWLRSQPRFFDGTVALANGYRDFAQLGADRWHCMLGACASIRAPALVVVNAGTATTVDCIERHEDTGVSWSGRFVGGFIVPGIRLMIESLAANTAELPAAVGPVADFPDHTDAAITSGVLDAQAGLVDQVRRRLAARRGVSPQVMVTGGHAAALAARLTVDTVVEDNLVLRGLALRAQSESDP